MASNTDGSAGPSLPAGLHELERFADIWALGTEQQRSRERLSRPIDELRELYSATIERIDDALSLLEKYRPEDLDDKHRKLYYLLLSFCEVAPAVELFKQPQVVDGFDPARFEPVRVPHMTPEDI